MTIKLTISPVPGAGGRAFVDLGSATDDLDITVASSAWVYIWGGQGHDTLRGGDGAFTAFGGAGDDLLVGGLGSTWLEGGAGNDTLMAQAAANGGAHLQGGAGNDVLVAPGMPAGFTPQQLDSPKYRITMNGGEGDDVYVINSLRPQVVAEEKAYIPQYTTTPIEAGGHDRVVLTFGHGTTFRLGAGIEDLTVVAMVDNPWRPGVSGQIWGNELDNLIILLDGAKSAGLIPFLHAGDGHDTVIGSSYADEIYAGRGHDLVRGMAGDDRISGYQGNDTLDGGTGADTLDGGEGDDHYYVDSLGDIAQEGILGNGAGGVDHVFASVWTWTLHASIEHLTYNGSQAFTGIGNGSANIITGGAKGDALHGMGGDDHLVGLGGDDGLHGGAGADTLDGGAGRDTLNGGEGNDLLRGGAGDDLLRGGAGRDTMLGGEGADVFAFAALSESTPTAMDVIMDFERGLDRINLHAIDANVLLAGDQAFNWLGVLRGNPLFNGAGDLWGVQTARGIELRGDVNGDGLADFALEVRGTVTLSAADFVL